MHKSTQRWVFWPVNFFSEKQKKDMVGSKVKRRISKQVLQENKARQMFRKTNSSYPLKRTRTYEYQGVRHVLFSEHLACFVFL